MQLALSALTPRTLVARAAQTAVLGGLVVGAVAFTSLDTTVTVSVDGAPRQVTTYAGTVGGALQRAGIELGAHDVVAPAPATAIADGTTIVVERGRQVQLDVDGTTRTVWVTARSVDELLTDLDLRADGARLSADRSTRIPLTGLALSLRLPKTLTLVADGRTQQVTTTATSLAEMLTAQGVIVGAKDAVTPDISTAPRSGQTVTVVRVAGSTVTRDIPLPYATVLQPDPRIYVGQKRVLRPGVAGVHRQTFELTLRDGVETGRTMTHDDIVRQPVAQIIGDGTLARPAPKPVAAPVKKVARPAAPAPAPVRTATAPRSSTAGVDGLNWAGLARCESGGDPQAYNPAGYYGLYQFSIGTWQGVGGTGRPTDHTGAEQTYRAKLLYQRTGASSWPTCGKYL